MGGWLTKGGFDPRLASDIHGRKEGVHVHVHKKGRKRASKGRSPTPV